MKLSLESSMSSLSDDLDAAVLIASLLQSKTADEYLAEAQECIVLANQCSARGDRLGAKRARGRAKHCRMLAARLRGGQ